MDEEAEEELDHRSAVEGGDFSHHLVDLVAVVLRRIRAEEVRDPPGGVGEIQARCRRDIGEM